MAAVKEVCSLGSLFISPPPARNVNINPAEAAWAGPSLMKLRMQRMMNSLGGVRLQGWP